MSSVITPHTLLGNVACGSVIVECAFALAGLPLTVETLDQSPGSASLARLLEFNPLGQVPVLLMPDGNVLTESLAMLFYVHDLAPEIGLVPSNDPASRARFFHWAVFLVAAVYPTFTYGDEPRRWVEEASAARLRQSTDQHRMDRFTQMEAAAGGPYFLGEAMSGIDLYLAAMIHWRPRAAWFELEAPKLAAIARRVAALPKLAPILSRHFPAASAFA